MKSCLNCGKEIPKSKASRVKVHCDVFCASEYRKMQKINKWISGEWDGNGKLGIASTIRKYVIEQAGRKCQRCGWGEINPALGYAPVELSHIDGNYLNNRPENLEILCPNCHSLEPTYKRLNKTGRAWRSDYDQFNAVTEENRKTKPRDPDLSICSCGNPKYHRAKTCNDCYNTTGRQAAIEWPSTEEVVSLVELHGYLQAGKLLGVSDNTVRNFLRRNDVDPKNVKRKKPAKAA